MSAADKGPLFGVVAEFDDGEALKAAAKQVRDRKFKHWDCYTPYPVHGIEKAMGVPYTILPALVFGAGVTGCAGGLLLQWWTNAYDWKWLVSGKPFFSLPANIPITFESTVLISAFAAFFGMWALNRLPRLWHPFDAARHFGKVTSDGFFIGIEARDPAFDAAETVELLRGLGAHNVELVHVDPDPVKKRIPRWIIAIIAVSTVMAAIPFALVARARVSKSDKPHYYVFPDMDFQFKYRAQNASELFQDGRATRPPIAGTVAVGELRSDDHFYRGIVREQGGGAAAWATTFPDSFEVTPDAMKRGRERFDIYCQPCHGAAGNGDGFIDKRAKETEGSSWSPPTSLHMEHIVRQPHGQIFNTISHGIRTMQGYASQIPEADRWAIILYLRALQRSQTASASDAPADALEEESVPAPGGAAPGPAPGGAAPAPAPGTTPPAGAAPPTAPAPTPASQPAAPAPKPAGGAN